MTKSEYLQFLYEFRKLVTLYRDHLEGFGQEWKGATGRLCPFYVTDSIEEIIGAVTLEIKDEGEAKDEFILMMEGMWKN